MIIEKSILLAGYGWFKGIPEGEINCAEQIACALDGQTLEAQLENGDTVRAKIHSVIAPVVWNGAFAPVQSVADALRPDVILGIGTDARAGGLRPEPYGVNWRRGTDAPPENIPETTKDEPIDEGGEPVLRGTLPYEAMTLAMLRAGIPAHLGYVEDADADAPTAKKSTTGYYLCNYMAYRLAQYAKTCGYPVRAGFIHVPTQPAYAAARRLGWLEDEPLQLSRPINPSMPLDMMIEGVKTALAACLTN